MNSLLADSEIDLTIVGLVEPCSSLLQNVEKLSTQKSPSPRVIIQQQLATSFGHSVGVFWYDLFSVTCRASRRCLATYQKVSTNPPEATNPTDQNSTKPLVKERRRCSAFIVPEFTQFP